MEESSGHKGGGGGADEGDGGNGIYLYKVIDRASISREEVRGLWREGKVSGLFNLPTEELFNACRDFGVKVDIGDLKKAKEETVVLRSKLKVLIERSVDKERELFKLKTKVADLSQANLLQEEDFKRKLHELTNRNKTLTKERKKLVKEKNDVKEENQRLKAEMERVKQELEEAKQRQRRREEQLQKEKAEQERRTSEKQQGKGKEKGKETEGSKASVQREVTQRRALDPPQRASSPAVDRGRLQAELKRERDLLKQLAMENQRLTARVQQLMIENEEMKLSSSITQTDHLNRSLLLSFMNTMDSLNLVEEEPEVEGDEWDEIPGEEEYYDDGDYYEGEDASSALDDARWITSHDDADDSRGSRESSQGESQC